MQALCYKVEIGRACYRALSTAKSHLYRIKTQKKATCKKWLDFFILFAFVSLACAAENVNELMTNDLFDVSACGLKIFSGVKFVGLLC